MPITDGNFSVSNLIPTGGKGLEKMEKTINNFQFQLIRNRNPILGKVYLPNVVEDLKIKDFLKKELSTIKPLQIAIERLSSPLGGLKITIHSNRLCSKEKIKKITKNLKKLTQKEILIDLRKTRNEEAKPNPLIDRSVFQIDENKVYNKKRKISYTKILKRRREEGFEK